MLENNMFKISKFSDKNISACLLHSSIFCLIVKDFFMIFFLVLEIHCPKIDGKGIFTIKYSNNRKVNSTAQFFCIASNKKVSGCNFMTCQQNGEWSGEYPTCVGVLINGL